MKSFVKQIGPAEDEYAPSWPPMSPISTSFFVCWPTYDLGIGARRKTLGHVIIAVAAERAAHPGILTLMHALQDSRMGIYRVQERGGARVRLGSIEIGAITPNSAGTHRSKDVFFMRLTVPRRR